VLLCVYQGASHTTEEEEKMKEQLKEKIRNLNAQIMAAFDQGNFIERDRLCAIKDDYLDELIGEDQ